MNKKYQILLFFFLTLGLIGCGESTITDINSPEPTDIESTVNSKNIYSVEYYLAHRDFMRKMMKQCSIMDSGTFDTNMNCKNARQASYTVYNSKSDGSIR